MQATLAADCQRLAAGVFLLIAPRIVSFAVAIYLIIVGLVGLNGIYHIFK